MRRRIVELDGLRGIAAISVVLYHYFYRYNELFGHHDIPTNWAKHGVLGVQLFFLISGFVIFWSLSNATKSMDFIVNRFARLYPIYWAAVIITFVVVSIFGLPGRTVSFTDFIGNFLMFHGYFRIPNVDGVYWTLGVELMFYLGMVIIFSLKALDRIDYIILPSLLFIGTVYLNLIHIPELAKKLMILQWLPFFMIGISLFKINSKTFDRLTLINLSLSLLLSIVTFSLTHFFIFCAFTLAFHLAVIGKLKVLKNPILVFLGNISYPLYLLHQNIGYVIIRKEYAYHFNPILATLIAIAIVIGLSYLAHLYVEKPSTRFIKDAYKKKQHLAH